MFSVFCVEKMIGSDSFGYVERWDSSDCVGTNARARSANQYRIYPPECWKKISYRVTLQGYGRDAGVPYKVSSSSCWLLLLVI